MDYYLNQYCYSLCWFSALFCNDMVIYVEDLPFLVQWSVRLFGSFLWVMWDNTRIMMYFSII